MKNKVWGYLKNIYESLDLFNLGHIGVFFINTLMLCRFNYISSIDLFLLSFIVLFFTAKNALTDKYSVFVKLSLVIFASSLVICKYFFQDSMYFILIKSIFLFFVYFLFYKNLKMDQLFIVERTYIQFLIWFFIVKFLFINSLSSLSNESSFHFDLKSLHLAFNMCLAMISLLTFSMDFYIKFRRNERERIYKKDIKEYIVFDVKSFCNSKEAEVLERSILAFFESKKGYLAFDFTLNMLAKYLEAPAVTVSNVINNRLHTSFYKLVALYRIKYAKEIILKQEDITFKFISESCGFKSKSTFNKYFLKFVGQSPSEFKNSLK